MIQLMTCVFYATVFSVAQLSAMHPVQQSLELLPLEVLSADELYVVTLNSDLQSLGRLRVTNKHFNNEIIIENLLKNAAYPYFPSVEKCLYFHAPKLIYMEDGDNKQHLQQALSQMIVAHEKKIDPAIFEVYESVKDGDWGKFFVESAELQLDNKKRLLFYCGKLPGRILEDGDLEHMKESGISENDVYWDVVEAAYRDALLAIEASNIPRLKVILDRHAQFPNGPEGLLSMLCKLKGRSDLVINYISLPDRGIDYVEEGYDVCDFALSYHNDQLINDLAIWVEATQNKNRS